MLVTSTDTFEPFGMVFRSSQTTGVVAAASPNITTLLPTRNARWTQPSTSVLGFRVASALFFALLIMQPARAVERLDSARLLTIGPAYSGSSVNVVANRRHALFTHGRTQFAAYYDAQGYVTLARRTLGEVAWLTRRSDFKGNVKDAHNSISIAVDGEGFLHVAWDHHDSALNYARSVRPLDMQLARVASTTGSAQQRVTYPEFHRLPNGDLLFLYRDGQSGRGRLVLDRYSTRERVWSTVQSNLIDGEGSRSPYWGFTVDTHGGAHLAWIWRDTPDVASNHDLGYAHSQDGGASWKAIQGSSLHLPLTVSSDAYAARIPTRHNLMNPPWITSDTRGRPYIMSYWSDAADSAPQFRVVYHLDGKWRTETITNRPDRFELAGTGTRRPPISRGVLLTRGTNDRPAAYLIYRDDAHSGDALLLSTEQLGSGPWRERKLMLGSLGAWEPTIDPMQWQQEEQIHLLVQAVHQQDGNDVQAVNGPPSDIGTLIIRPRDILTATRSFAPDGKSNQ